MVWGLAGALAGAGVQAQVSDRFLSRTAPYLPYQDFLTRNYNLRWGRLAGRFSASTQLELNDNINLAQRGARADVLVGPQADFGFLWALSEANVMQLDLGVGYRWYWDNARLNALTIAPDSLWEYRLLIRDVQLNVHDEFSLQIDPTSRPELSGLGRETLNFRRFRNTSGVSATWQATRHWSLVAGYDFTLDRTMSDEFAFLDHDTHQFSAATYHTLSPRWTAGLAGSLLAFDYARRVQNGGTGYALGPVVAFKPSTFVLIDATLGYSAYRFDRTGTLVDGSNFGGLTFQGGVRHTLNSRASHSLRVRKAVELGFGSNFTDLWEIQYGVTARVSSAISLNGRLAYEHYRTSGQTPERAERYLAYLGTGYQITRYWTAGIGYSFSWKNSAVAGRDYTQNRLTLEFSRRF